MPPKKVQKAIAKAIKAPNEEAEQLKRERSTMITCLAKRVATGTATSEEKSTLETYQGAPRFSALKDELLANYKKDKSCKWFTEYTHKIDKEKTDTMSGQSGYATMFQP